MRIHRGLLFWGLFLIPLGAIPLLARAGALDLAIAGQAWRFWPLILVAIGLAILVGRTRASLAAVAVLALALGSIAGAGLASGTGFLSAAIDCGAERDTDARLDRNGSFTGPGAVRLDLRCGSVDLTMVPGSDWSLHATHAGVEPDVEATGTLLSVDAERSGSAQRQHWTVTAPVDQTEEIELKANAAGSQLHLDGADLGRVEADVNAGDLLVDAGNATLDQLNVEMNAGRARITLGDTPLTGRIQMNAGAIDLCVPPTAELRLSVNEQLTFVNNLDERGLTRSGDVWHRAGTTGAPAIDLSIEGNAANLTLDPEGGCR
jgi:hypothetical protein